MNGNSTNLKIYLQKFRSYSPTCTTNIDKALTAVQTLEHIVDYWSKHSEEEWASLLTLGNLFIVTFLHHFCQLALSL